MESPKELKDQLVNTYGIHTDRDLLAQLGITNDDDKKKLFLWIRYQCSFAYREGLEQSAEQIRELIEWQPASELIFDTLVTFLLEHDDEQLIITGTARKAGNYWDLIPLTGVSYDRNYWNCNKWKPL